MDSRDGVLRRIAWGLLLIALSEVLTAVGVLAYAGLAFRALVRAGEVGDYRLVSGLLPESWSS
jgi:hypothetical protein